MSLSAAVKSVTSALTSYDRDITVKAVTRQHADSEVPGCLVVVDGYRLQIGERSKKGFKSLGYVDLALDEAGEVFAACHFSTRSETLSSRVAGALAS